MSIYSLEPLENSSQLNAALLRTLKPHETPVVSGAIDRTGTLLATGSAEGLIKVWDIRGGYVSHTFRGHTGIISALTFFEHYPERIGNRTSANSRRSSAGLSTKDSAKMRYEAKTDHDDQRVFHLASGGDDGKIRIWDLAKRKATATLESHVSVVKGLEYSSEQQALVSASRDKTAIIWDVGSWKARKVIPVLESLESVGFVCAGSYICTGGEFGRPRVWDTNSGREVTQEQERGNEAEGIVQMLFQSSKQSVLSVRVDRSLILHSTDSLTKLEPGLLLPCLPIKRRIIGNHDEIIDLAHVSLTGGMLALATNSESLHLVTVANSDEETFSDGSSHYFGADVGLLQGHDGIVICLDVDWSGCWLATGAKDNTARLWRIDQANQSYECFAVLTGHTESLGAVALPTTPPQAGSTSSSNPLLMPPPFVLTGSQDKTIKRWNLSPRSSTTQMSGAYRSVYTRKAHDKDINAISINHDSKLFASASQDRSVKIWSTEEGEVQGVLRGHKRGVWSVRFAPKDVAPISGSSVPVSSVRGLVVTGSGDKTVKVWSLSDYSCLRTFEGHTNSVLKVLWILPEPADLGGKDGRSLLASGGGDGLVKIWDASTGECVCTLDNHTDRVWALATHTSTGHLVSGGGDGVITFWVNTTATTAAASAAASEARVEQEQLLLNHVHRGDYHDAIMLALQLKHPARLLALFSDVVKTHPPERGSVSGLKAVDDVIRALSDEQLYALLLRLRDWNTNAKTAAIAQRILAVVIRNHPAERLANLQQRNGGLNDMLQALMTYTDRHYKRIEELIEESYLVDFIVKEMEEGGFLADGD